MRASTLFALSLAVLAGLGTAVAIKYSGAFNKPAEVVAAKPPDINILVAARNIFSGDLINPTDVVLRPLRPEEKESYEKNKDQYMPAVVNATALRIAAKNIEADKPIRRELLQDMLKPDSLSTRLLPQMRAVNIAATKDHSAGGLIQVGEWVDVVFTTEVTAEGMAPTTRTAVIAHKLRVIGKRNVLWPVFQPLPEDKPVTFTLEANPYRSGLIEYAKNKGQLALSPVSSAEQKGLEEKRAGALKNGEQFVSFVPLFSKENSAEYQDEDGRVSSLNRGDLTIGNGDLMRIFNLKIASPEPPVAPVQPVVTAVQQFSGLARLQSAAFNTDNTPYEPPARNRVVVVAGGPKNTGGQIPGISFGSPKCNACDKKDQGNTRPIPLIRSGS